MHMPRIIDGGPTLARRQLGRRLRLLREQARKTIEDVIESNIASRTKMWRIEAGRIAVREGDVLALARLYGVETSTINELVRLAAATKDSGFQEDFAGSVSRWAGLYGELEAAAVALQTYNCELIPGLLQTADYAHAVTVVDTTLSPRVVEQRVAFRMQRQRQFFGHSEPRRLDAVIPAGVLGLVVASPTVMEAQIAHLRAVSSRGGVSVRVLSATNGVHGAMHGSFIILDFNDPNDPPVVYLESLIGSRYVERRDHVLAFRDAFGRMREQAVPLEEYLG